MANRVDNCRAVLILQVTSEKTIELNEDALTGILMADDVKDLPVVVISIAGAFRKGKSFILNFFLRYLRNGCKDDWLGDPTAPLEGFHWHRGYESDTKGIWVWHEAIQVTKPDGQKVAVILMDTQGAFGCDATIKETTIYIALSTMLSSVQIYNLSNNIQEDDLENLRFFTDYGKLSRKHTSEKPFQKLFFLVRDWNFPLDAPYGSAGGRDILMKRLFDSAGKLPEMKKLQDDLISCFDKFDCFLMPHPGLKVVEKKEFIGSLVDLTENFKEHLAALVNLLLKPENLLAKQCSGKMITCEELMAFFKEYKKKFCNGKLPTPESMHKANARANHEVAVQSAMKDYVTRMNELCNEEQAPLTKSELTEAHDKSLKSAKLLFDSIPKIGGSTISKQYRARLTQDAKDRFKDYKEKNDLKRDMIKKKSGMSDLAGAGSAAAVAAIGLLPLGLPGEIVAIVPVVTRCAIATYKFFAKAKKFFSSRSKAKKQEKKEADQENEETLEEGYHYSDDEVTLEDEDQEDEQLQ
ncbi:atlastin-like [Amblyomma americanum]